MVSEDSTSSLACQDFHEDLHATIETIIREGAAVFKLLAGKDEVLLSRGMPGLSWVMVLPVRTIFMKICE
jgi:hypothetical protein